MSKRSRSQSSSSNRKSKRRRSFTSSTRRASSSSGSSRRSVSSSWMARAGSLVGAAAGAYGTGSIAGAKLGANLGRTVGAMAARYRSNKTATLRADVTGLQVRDLGTIIMGSKKIVNPKTIGTYRWHNINQWVIQGTPGRQVSDFPEVMFTRNQLQGTTNSNRLERYTWDINPYDLNPYVGRPLTTLYSAITGFTKTDVLNIQNVRYETSIVSLSKLPQIIELLFMTPKNDTSVNPIDTWLNVLGARGEGQSVQTTSNTIGITTAASGEASINDVGQTPYSLPEFNSQWTSIKKFRIVLQAGEQINLKFKIEMNKVIRKHTLDLRTEQFLKGYTVFPLFIAHSGLVGLSTADGVATTEVSYGPVKFGVVTNQQITFGAVSSAMQSTSRTYSGVVVNTVNNQRMIDDEDDIDDGDMNA